MKKGISLIVLVITIIVMIILAASVVITLSNTGVINRASQAVDLTNESAVQDLAALIWADAYMDGKREEVLVTEVKNDLKEAGITDEKYNITITNSGVTVLIKNNWDTTLGELITSAADYGKTINYISDNGVVEWKVFYHTSDSVYLIASEKLAYNKLPHIPDLLSKEATVTFGENDTRKVGQLYYDIDNIPLGVTVESNVSSKWMANFGEYSRNESGRFVSYLLSEEIWSGFRSTIRYKDNNGESYVKGAIGSPTAEMFIASWNSKRAIEDNTDKEELTLVSENEGYIVNGVYDEITISTTDTLYIWTTEPFASVWLASPSGYQPNTGIYICQNGYFGHYNNTDKGVGVRPLVCLSSDIPATTDDNGNFII